MWTSSSTVACTNACFKSNCLSSRFFIAVVSTNILRLAPNIVGVCFRLKCRPGTFWNRLATNLSFYTSPLLFFCGLHGILIPTKNLLEGRGTWSGTLFLYEPRPLESIAPFQCGHSDEAVACSSVIGSGRRKLATPSGIVSAACIAMWSSKLALFSKAAEELTPPTLRIAPSAVPPPSVLADPFLVRLTVKDGCRSE